MAKGGKFERDTCRQLSRWWSGDPDPAADVLFWRTAGSGGRATTRAKSGKQTTAAHCGDLAAIDDRGAPLTAVITFELKKGYGATVLGLLTGQSQAKRSYAAWIQQAEASAAAAGTPHWAVVHKPDYQPTVVVLPYDLFGALEWPVPHLAFHSETTDVACCLWDGFLAAVPPDAVASLGDARSRPEGARRVG